MIEEFLTDMQDSYLEKAKDILRTDGDLSQICFIITKASNLESAREIVGLHSITTGDSKDDPKDVDDDDTLVLAMDMSDHPRNVFKAICGLYPEAAEHLTMAITMGKDKFNIEDPYPTVVKAFLHTTQTNSKDILTGFIRLFCDKVDAFAVINLSAAYSIEAAETETYRHGDLSKNPNSKEVVFCTLDTVTDGRRMLTVPIFREPSEGERDSGKVIGFGEISETIDNKDGKDTITGRYAELLKPLSKSSSNN